MDTKLVNPPLKFGDQRLSHTCIITMKQSRVSSREPGLFCRIFRCFFRRMFMDFAGWWPQSLTPATVIFGPSYLRHVSKSANAHEALGGRNPRNCRRIWTLISSSRLLGVPILKIRKNLPGLPILKIQDKSQISKTSPGPQACLS